MIILADKPHWITSHDLVGQFRRKLWTRAVWHCWTLDPYATGLMILCTDKDTKQVQFLTWMSKSYQTIIDFSIKTDTRDMQYWKNIEYLDFGDFEKNNDNDKDVKNTDVKNYVPTETDIKNELDNLIWTHQLQVPYFASKKVDGKKLYEYAREWKPYTLLSDMTINSYQIINYSFPVLELKLDVWSGTYIRTIWHLLWEKFGIGWTLTSLRRLSIWKWDCSMIDPVHWYTDIANQLEL